MYNVTLTNLVNVCPFKQITKDVIVNPLISINAIDDQIKCLGDTLTFVASANIDNVTYTWTDINGAIITNGNTLEVVLNNDATYTLAK